MNSHRVSLPLAALAFGLLIGALALGSAKFVGFQQSVHPSLRARSIDHGSAAGLSGMPTARTLQGQSTLSLARGQSGAGIPRAVVPEKEFHFGDMDPLTTAEHAFVIRNEGSAPLTLRKGSTTCKCTLADLTEDAVPPGGEARVRLVWNTGDKIAHHRHQAAVFTNDPQLPQVEFLVEGTIRRRVTFDPPELVLPKVGPDERAAAKVLVYSQVWEDFSIGKSTTSLGGLTWSAEPADQKSKARVEARSAYLLTVSLPNDLPQGQFRGWLRLEIQPSGGDATFVELPVLGYVVRRLAVYGPQVDATGRVALGVLRAGEGSRAKLTLKLRDQQHELTVRNITSEPGILRAHIDRISGTDPRLGLYEMDIEVPKDAAPCEHYGIHAGWVRVATDHPRVPLLELKVEFTVLPDATSALSSTARRNLSRRK